MIGSDAPPEPQLCDHPRCEALELDSYRDRFYATTAEFRLTR
jgi:hypothetical protein